MSQVFELADAYLDRFCALNPVEATTIGILGHDDEITDYSPDGAGARVALARSTLTELDGAAIGSEPDRLAAAVLRDRLTVVVEGFEAGAPWRQLSNLDSPVSYVRMAFDLQPRATPEDWERIALRMALVPRALEGFIASLRHGLATGVVAARRQAVACAVQAATLGGLDGGADPYFVALAVSGAQPEPLGRRLRSAADAATTAYAGLARFLRDEYAPRAREVDAVGADLYRIGIHRYLGMACDPEAAYAWGWEELHRIEAEMERVAELIAPGEGVAGAVAVLEGDPSRSIEGIDNLLAWLQDLTDRTLDDLDGVHFDIPEPLRRIECCEAPPGSSEAIYYTAPSTDFSRPGRTWHPAHGRTRFPLWSEVTTAYHEGAPGHHLQIGLCMTFGDRLTRFQRLLGRYPGHSEGWALYAERLMDELGYLERPDYRFGMLSAQAFRAMRVIVDIGLHLQLRIPPGEAYEPGRVWDWDVALPFVNRYIGRDAAFATSELIRYCGMPAQAICYKIGERAWLDIRSQMRARRGAAFDLKRFHMDALNLGSLPLDVLQQELAGTG